MISTRRFVVAPYLLRIQVTVLECFCATAFFGIGILIDFSLPFASFRTTRIGGRIIVFCASIAACMFPADPGRLY
jgi:hypothetical protein